MPALNIGGWFDGFMRGTARCYAGVRARGATDVDRQQHTLNGDGRLSLDPPRAAEPAGHFLYNPLSPVPTCGGAHLHGIPGVFDTGVQEQRAVQAREDVWVYTSAPLTQDTEVTGHVSVRLWAATSALDTDWTAMLVDVHPDGRAYNVCDGILRARYRESLEQPSPIEPSMAYPYTLELGPTSMLFRRGHCLRLTVSSSNFPAYARNLNTGASMPMRASPARRCKRFCTTRIIPPSSPCRSWLPGKAVELKTLTLQSYDRVRFRPITQKFHTRVPVGILLLERICVVSGQRGSR